MTEESLYDYEAQVKLISTLRQSGDLEAVRKARLRFNSLLLLKLADWSQWIEDEVSMLSGSKDDKVKVKELFEMALKDHPASIDLWLEYLNFCKVNPEIIQDLNKEILRASAFAAWNLREGHKLLLLQHSPNPRAIPYTLAAKIAMNLEDSTPSPFESFEGKFPDSIEKYIEAVKNSKFMNSTDKLTLCRVIFERAIEADPTKFQVWENYIKFLRSEMNVSTVILGINHRLTRAHPLLVNSWILLFENLELFGLFDEFELEWTSAIPETIFEESRETFLAIQSARLDCLRRQGKGKELFSTFEITIQDEEQAFGIDPQGRLSRYFAQVLLSHGEIEKFRNVWQQLLKQHAKEAGFWLEYLQLERSLALKEGNRDVNIVLNGFKRASAAVTDYPETIFYEWLQFERQNSSSLQSLLDARDRIDKQRKLLKEREEQRQVKEIKENASRKRSRTVEMQDKRLPPPPEQQPLVLKSFDPDATLFVNNLPFSFSEKDIKTHFDTLLAELPDVEITNRCAKSIRMHMNSSGNAFKGHATIEFDCPETAKILLESFNRRSADESGRPVFLAKYVSPLEKKCAAPSVVVKSESDAKTLYVSNLPFKETLRVEDLFKSLKGIQQIRHVQGKQFAFIEFESEQMAGEALKEIPQIDKTVKAAFSKPPPPSSTSTIKSASTSSTISLLKPRSVSMKK